METLDRMPQGEPETIIRLPDGRLLGLKIRGVEKNKALGIRVDQLGRPESCSVLDVDTDDDGA
jgi:hypothetical protein